MAGAVALLPELIVITARFPFQSLTAERVGSLAGLHFSKDPPPPRV
jgi:hypothetical protein